MNFPKAISVKAIEKYKILLKYDDGTEGLLDLSDCAGKEVFKYWEEGDNFFNVSIEPLGGGISWSPDLDICPNAAYLTIKGLTFEEWRSLNQPHASTL
ncbi:MAG: DUF2442 domain-containing protein [Flavisolibacter sp.]|nr:DUF2442 domain-containing protein [Flavisolibacter sp.]